MSKELVVSSNRHETRLAILEDDRLVEIYVERRSNHAIAGSIYKGRVSRVLPGMQSAFVKLGLARDAFLYVSDVLDKTADLERGDDPDPADGPEQERSAPDRSGRGGSGRGRGGRSDSRRRDSRRPDRNARKDSDRELEFTPKAENAAAEDSASGEARADGESSRESGRSDDRQSGRRGRDGDRERTRVVADQPADEQREDRRDDPREEPVADATTDEQGDAPEAVENDDRGFAVLPGESLAKYGSGDEEPDDQEDNQEEPEALDDDLDSSDGEAGEELDDDIEYDDDIEDGSEEPLAASAGGDDADEVESESVETEVEAAADDSDDEAGDSEEHVDESEPELDETATEQIDASSEDEDRSVEMPGQPQPESDDAAPEADAVVRETSESSRFQRRGRRGRRRRRGRGSDEAQTQESRQTETRTDSESEGAEAEEPTQVIASDGLPNIKDLLDPGQELIVQIAKEPLGKKGARITSHIALPGRFMVYMPTVNHNGVSRKIHSDTERARLRRVVRAHAEGKPGGFIVRTAGRGASDEELQADVDFLYAQWQGIIEKAESRRAPALLYHDLDVVERVMRDQLGQNYKTIWVDGEEEYERVLRFVERFQPDLLDRVKLYTRAMPIYDEFNISQELEKALRPKVWLKSGGYLVINQTEALVSIDVNTGKYVGKSDRLEDTILKTNMEAAEEVVRQMRLRDLGGIIIVDFIDMEDRKNRHGVHQTLEAALRRDRAPSKALPFNDFGLIAITRKRVKQSLERALCTPCPTCAGSGSVKSVPTVVGEILNESRKLAIGAEDTRDVVLRVHPEVAKVLKSRTNAYLQELEDTFKANVLVRGDVEMHPDQYNFH